MVAKKINKISPPNFFSELIFFLQFRCRKSRSFDCRCFRNFRHSFWLYQTPVKKNNLTGRVAPGRYRDMGDVSPFVENRNLVSPFLSHPSLTNWFSCLTLRDDSWKICHPCLTLRRKLQFCLTLPVSPFLRWPRKLWCSPSMMLLKMWGDPLKILVSYLADSEWPLMTTQSNTFGTRQKIYYAELPETSEKSVCNFNFHYR